MLTTIVLTTIRNRSLYYARSNSGRAEKTDKAVMKDSPVAINNLVLFFSISPWSSLFHHPCLNT